MMRRYLKGGMIAILAAGLYPSGDDLGRVEGERARPQQP